MYQVPDDYENFFRKPGLLCIPLSEPLEKRLVAQAFVSDVMIIQIDEAFEPCPEGSGRATEKYSRYFGFPGLASP